MGSSFPKPKLPFFAPKDIKVSFKQENSQSKKRILKHIKISILFGLRKMLLWKLTDYIMQGVLGRLCYYKCNGRVGTQM